MEVRCESFVLILFFDWYELGMIVDWRWSSFVDWDIDWCWDDGIEYVVEYGIGVYDLDVFDEEEMYEEC